MITREYKEINGIKIFNQNLEPQNEDYNHNDLDKLYNQEEKHFWFITRKEYILKKMKKIISLDTKTIEIGAGTGNVSRHLTDNGYTNIAVGEMHLSGLKYAKSYGIKDCYQFNLLEPPFKEEFDTVCMFDVLEHIEDHNLALRNISNILKNNGHIVLTVPSHMWLWNRDDKLAGHKTRYSKIRLETILKKNGFEIITSKYFFISIAPLLLLRRVLKKDTQKPVTDIERNNNNISMNPLLNSILLLLTRIENKLSNFLPNILGGSLFVIARKK